MRSEYFSFDGITSESMGLYIVRMSSNTFIESPYWGNRSIREEQQYNKLIPYFYGVEREPIEFTLELALLNNDLSPQEWTSAKRFELARWLLHDTYKEFISSDDLGKIYYAICINDVNTHLINDQGYMELVFRTNSPFAWTPTMIVETDLSDNNTTAEIQYYNYSNVVSKYRPQLEIELVDDTRDIILRNDSNGGKEFKFTGLQLHEIVSVDNENELILSNIPNSTALSKFNKQWLELVYGENRIVVTGKCKITMRAQFPIAQ